MKNKYYELKENYDYSFFPKKNILLFSYVIELCNRNNFQYVISEQILHNFIDQPKFTGFVIVIDLKYMLEINSNTYKNIAQLLDEIFIKEIINDI